MNSKEQIKILLKDLQDTYLLVKRFENLSEVPKIEMDLALSKVRNLYDLMLKVDVENFDAIPEIEKDDLIVDSTSNDSEEARVLEWKLAKEKELQKQKEEKQSEVLKEPEPIVEEKIIEAPIEKKVEVVEPVVQEENVIIKEKDEEIVEIKEPEFIIETPTKTEIQENGKSIVADRFQNKKSMNDSISDSSVKVDRAARMQKKPIKDMHNAIGVNDKFLFIRELFEGDKERYWETIQVLNNFDSFENAYHFLKEEFTWDFEDDTVTKLVGIIQRKFANQ